MHVIAQFFQIPIIMSFAFFTLMVVSVMVLSFLGLIVMAAVKVGDQFLGELL